MEFKLKNNAIEVRVESKGAELTGIKDLVTGQEYVWQKDPKFWAKSSPVLFPFVGAIKEDRYFYNGQEYNIKTKHGFARDNEFKLSSQGENFLEFVFESNEETRKIYPFDFKFFMKYIIEEKTVKIEYRVENLTDGDMYFSLGAHPAFNAPTDENIKVTDYYIEFEKKEDGEIFGLNGALISSKDKIKFFEGNRINLERDRFINDAAIIGNPNSKVVWLRNSKNSSGVKFEYDGFKYIAFWNVPGADYVCFEPWNGISDYDNASGELTEKVGIEKLEKGGQYTRELNITIF